MIKVGIAGVGFMGWMHYLAYKRVADVQLSAICSRSDAKRAGDWRGIQGNFGPPGEQIDVSGIQGYRSLDELLADPSIDLVDLCLPPHVHAEASIAALRAGKHVFCEKPMALTPEECDAMMAASKETGKLLFVGQVLPMFPEYSQTLKWIREGTYGAVTGGTFRRVISDPTWLEDFYEADRVGGPLVDLHIHDAHLIRLIFGMPTAVMSQGRMRGDVVEYCHTLFQFDQNDFVVHAESGVIRQQGRPFTHGFHMQLEQATVLFEFAVLGGEAELIQPLTVLTEDGEMIRAELPQGDEVTPFVLEIEEVARSIKSGTVSDILGGTLARDALVLCHCQTDSVRQGAVIATS